MAKDSTRQGVGSGGAGGGLTGFGGVSGGVSGGTAGGGVGGYVPNPSTNPFLNTGGGGPIGGIPGTGGPMPPIATGPFTWNGARPVGTFDPKTFGTKLFGDLNTAYGQGPKATIPSFNPYSAETSGLIHGGLGALAPVANGGWLSGGNPYFEAGLTQTRDNTLRDITDQFGAAGRWGGQSYINDATRALADSENAARASNFENEWQRMMGAQGQGLGLSGLLDSKNAELIKSQQEQQAQLDPFNFIAKNYGLLTSGNGADANTNKPLSLWDILGGIGSVAGAFL